MFNFKCLLVILIIFRNSFHCRVVINEIQFDKDNAFIELAFESCESSCALSGMRLLILEEDASFLMISDIIILDNITTNSHGLFTIGSANSSSFQHQLKYRSDLLHGLALLQYVDLEQNNTISFDRFLHEVAYKLQRPNELP